MFDRIVGQDAIKKTLGSMIGSGAIPHALLFAGPNGTGKSETAFELARILLCENGLDSGCDSCSSCARTLRLEHPDLHILFPFRAQPQKSDDFAAWMDGYQEHRRLLAAEPYTPVVYDKARQIVVGLVEDVYERLMESSFEGGRRVCIIIAADRLNTKTGNTLLKIVEEPPEGVHFIMTTERLSSVLPTIISRTSVFRFTRLGQTEIESYLALSGLTDPAVRRTVASASEGSLKIAKALAFSGSSAMMERAVALFTKAAAGDEGVFTDSPLSSRSQEAEEAEELLYGYARVSKAILETKLGIPQPAGVHAETAARLARSTDMPSLNRLAAGLERGLDMLGRNVTAAMIMSTIHYEIYDAFGKGRTKS